MEPLSPPLPLPPAIVDRYLAGDATPDECVVVRERLARDPHMAAQFRMLVEEIQNAGKGDGQLTPSPADTWDVVVARTGLGARSSRGSGFPLNDGGMRALGRRSPRFRTSSQPFKIVLATAAGLTALWVTGQSLRIRYGSPPRPTYATYATRAGQQATVTLANDIRAVLGPATTLSFRDDRGPGVTATVSGEALFTVTHQAHAPFAVQTGNVVTRVLGTTFLVRHYETDSATRIVVAEGRVSVNAVHQVASASRGTILTAGTLGVVDDSGSVHVTPSVAIEDYTAWTTGTLVFRQTPVQDIVAELNRVYGADLRLTDSTLRRQAFTWTISTAQLSLAGALEVLTTALNAHLVRSGKVITIVPGPLESSPTAPPRNSQESPLPPSTPERLYGR